MIYIDNKLKYKTPNVLKLYEERKTECSFLEIVERHKKEKTIGCIYKHLKVPVEEFTNDYLGPPLEKLYREKKNVWMVGSNINILNCDSEQQTL